MTTCAEFCEELARIAFSLAPQPQVIRLFSARLEDLLRTPAARLDDWHGFDPALFADAFGPVVPDRVPQHRTAQCEGRPDHNHGRCSATGLPCMGGITHLAHFAAGREVGKLLHRALTRQFDEAAFRRELEALLGQ